MKYLKPILVKIKNLAISIFHSKTLRSLFFVLVGMLLGFIFILTLAANKQQVNSPTIVSVDNAPDRFVTLDDKSYALEPIKEQKEVLIPVRKLVLNQENTLYLYEEITGISIAKLTLRTKYMSEHLSPKKPIFLILITPGGDLEATLDYLEFTKTIPNPIITVTLKAASGGFLLVQGLGTRLITRTGILWDHYGSVGGVSGAPFTTFEKNVEEVRRAFDKRAQIIMKRMGLSYAQYLDLMHDDFKIVGANSLKYKAADAVVDISCDSDLMTSSIIVEESSFFGKLQIVYPACPLSSNPIDVRAAVPTSAPATR
jgi:ATP-dependent protease ClpP protease subunit